MAFAQRKLPFCRNWGWFCEAKSLLQGSESHKTWREKFIFHAKSPLI